MSTHGGLATGYRLVVLDRFNTSGVSSGFDVRILVMLM